MSNKQGVNTEQWRPEIHFTPKKNWMNDPNGMIYFNGCYHLFYQYNPSGDKWGNMHWGHATSTDLIQWQHKPIGLHAKPNGLGYIFSGGGVVDFNNTSGLGTERTPPLIATFTHHSDAGVQVQSIAYSLDEGESWQEYKHNPVIANPGLKDFRDPKVIWLSAQQKWLMALAAGQEIHFYCSDNLIDWQYLSAFGEGHGNHQGVWECPDIFPLTSEKGVQKWVLIVSIVPGGPNGGSGTQYFVGDFDGTTFIADHKETLWLDYGPDNYAGVTWDGLQVSDNRRVFIAWMSNWHYAEELPTSPWRSSMTLPRKLSLIDTHRGLRLANLPVREINELRAKVMVSAVSNTFDLPATAVEIVITCNDLSADKHISFENDIGEKAILNYRSATNTLALDRRCSGWSEKNFGQVAHAPLIGIDEQKLEIRLFFDKTSIEVFTEHGLTTMTANVFPSQPFTKLVVEQGIKASLYQLTK